MNNLEGTLADCFILLHKQLYQQLLITTAMFSAALALLISKYKALLLNMTVHHLQRSSPKTLRLCSQYTE